ncbi:beta-ketoacyl synthase N-terminal-like domain-containing protein [Micromonospora sp. WMMD1120]|uniref:beta-ketoacyl synthase N-terminal-like domain-containing protein n=1 Tax=Micromonospora sp. WMMD1120 TaxID=3016106 RepID=UPI0024178452|nr:beta-ketoacyl synthase N-terminal-like domain-containing protein [Micromonospora sp. WMMD1120]MDG4810829.1 beta-ketoacyl synthase N-terminal-like domain-containing protein [Micromonospora sp. WMMD1120]
MNERLFVTGIGVAVPGAADRDGVLSPGVPEPVDPADRIGRKGLRYKDRATQLALVAAYEALRDADLLADPDDAKSHVAVDAASVAVVAASNYGSLDSVTATVDTIQRDNSTRLVSPITTPNLSSNVIASEVAIRYGLRGPNLTVCNGATGGLDALRWAGSLLRAGRAERVLVVAAEPDNEIVRSFAGVARVLDGAVAVVLEPADEDADSPRSPHAVLAGARRAATVDDLVDRLGVEPAALAGWYEPEAAVQQHPFGVAEPFVLGGDWGTSSSVLGLLQCVDAAARFHAGGTGTVLAVCGDQADGAYCGVLVEAPRPPHAEHASSAG